MFLGQFEHSIDVKGRLTIPSSYRDDVPEGIYLMQGYDGNLDAYPKELFELLIVNTRNGSITQYENRSIRRHLFSTAQWLEFDSAGRILIPSFLKEIGGISSSVIIAGIGDYFEVWNPDKWAEIQSNDSAAESPSRRWEDKDIFLK